MSTDSVFREHTAMPQLNILCLQLTYEHTGLIYGLYNNSDDNNNNNNTIEIQRMWNVKTKVIPVIIGATGTISKSFTKYVSNIPGNREVKELQKTAILGTAHILWKVLM